MSANDLVSRARLVQRVNAHWSDSICECEECAEERFGLITPMADEIERLRADAARYRWLVARNPLMVASIAYSEPGACQYADVNEAVDAAMAAAVTVDAAP